MFIEFINRLNAKDIPADIKRFRSLPENKRVTAMNDYGAASTNPVDIALARYVFKHISVAE